MQKLKNNEARPKSIGSYKKACMAVLEGKTTVPGEDLFSNIYT